MPLAINSLSVDKEDINSMAGPKKSEVKKAAQDLGNPKTSKRQKSEASETMNYAKASKKKNK